MGEVAASSKILLVREKCLHIAPIIISNNII